MVQTRVLQPLLPRPPSPLAVITVDATPVSRRDPVRIMADATPVSPSSDPPPSTWLGLAHISLQLIAATLQTYVEESRAARQWQSDRDEERRKERAARDEARRQERVAHAASVSARDEENRRERVAHAASVSARDEENRRARVTRDEENRRERVARDEAHRAEQAARDEAHRAERAAREETRLKERAAREDDRRKERLARFQAQHRLLTWTTVGVALITVSITVVGLYTLVATGKESPGMWLLSLVLAAASTGGFAMVGLRREPP